LLKTRIRVVELDERVVAAAREHFALPKEVEVEIGDGADALSPECCDVLVIDAFQDELHVAELASREFYDGAFLALADPGVLVVNFMNDDPKLDQALQRLERAFGGAVIAMPALYDPNIIAFALKGSCKAIAWRELRDRAQRLEARLGLPFTRYVQRLRSMNRWTASDLIIVL
jgi:spermidine synthase